MEVVDKVTWFTWTIKTYSKSKRISKSFSRFHRRKRDGYILHSSLQWAGEENRNHGSKKLPKVTL